MFKDFWKGCKEVTVKCFKAVKETGVKVAAAIGIGTTAALVKVSPASATAAYDSMVTAADVSGLSTVQVTLLVGMIGFVVVSVAYAIISNTLKKGKGASR